MKLLAEEAPGFEAVQEDYDRMWAAGQPEIARNEVVADPVPGADNSSTRWGVSVIARINADCATADFASRLLALGQEVQPLCGQNHTFYNATNLHTTVRACEFYRDESNGGEVAGDNPKVETYRHLLGQLCRQFRPSEVRYAGLNGNHTGIIVQGYALGDLPEFRREFHRQLTECGLHHGPEAQNVRRTTHASLVVFGGPLAQPRAVSSWLAGRRTLTVGSVWLSGVSLVSYLRSRYDVELVVLDKFDFTG